MSTFKITTSKGDITVKLYDETPKHRDNFIKLAEEGYYEGTLFHRVIKGFMIQGGDPNSKEATPDAHLGTGGPGYTIPAEILPQFYHKRGALAAARQGDEVNPERESSGSQFYIVWGQQYNAGQISQLERQLQMQNEQQVFNRLVGEHRKEILEMRKARNQEGLMELQNDLIAQTKAIVKENPVSLSDEAKQAYTTLGGTPHLDGQYTVFGEVVEGLDVVGEIEKVKTRPGDRPEEDVKIVKVVRV